MSDDELFVGECAYYVICEKLPTAGNEGEDTTLLGSKTKRTPFTNKHKSLDNVHDDANDQPNSTA